MKEKRILSQPEIEVILQRNAELFGVTSEQIMGRRRLLTVSAARAMTQMEMFNAGMGVTTIGRVMGRDHSTVIHNIKIARAVMEQVGDIEPDQVVVREAWQIASEPVTASRKIRVNKAEESRRNKIEHSRMQKRLASSAITVVEKSFSLPQDSIISPSRKKEIARARHVVAYILHSCTDFSLKTIASIIGRIDHTTIMNSVARVEEAMGNNTSFEELIKELIVEVKVSADTRTS